MLITNMYNQLKTLQVNSNYHSNRVTHFEIPRKVLKNNVRLAGVGCYRVGGDATTAFPCSTGVMSLVNSITLMDDNKVIDTVRQAHLLYGWKNIHGDNGTSYMTNAKLYSNMMGWTLDPSALITPFSDTSSFVEDNATDATKNYIPLSRLLSFFQSATVGGSRMVDLPADKMKLTLVVEWNTDVTQFDGTTPASIVILEPFLICDEVLGGTSPKDVTVEYVSMEYDRLVVDAVAVDKQGVLKAKINAFNKKRLNRLVFINSPPAPVAGGCRQDCSRAQRDETIQFTVDGRQLFPYKGINTFARKAALEVDTFGKTNCPFSQNTLKLKGEADLLSAVTLDTDESFAYGSCWINARPEQLEVEYKRTGLVAADPTTAGFNLVFYGEVTKNLVLTGRDSIVVY